MENNEKLDNQYSLPNTIMVTPRRLTWVGHVVYKRNMINAYALLTAKAEEKQEIQANIKDNIAMNVKETGFERVDWFQLATGSGSIKVGNFLPSYATYSFSRTLHH